MSDSDNCERCENAAENKKIVDEKQQIIELIPEAWPPELKDIPVPSMIAMDDILQDAEEEMRAYLSVADQGIPERTILKHQLIAGGLRIIKNLVRDCLDDENIDNGKNVMEQLPLPVMRNNDQRKESSKVDGIMRGTPTDPDTEADPAAGNQKPESIYRSHDGKEKEMQEKKLVELLNNLMSVACDNCKK